MCVPIDTFKINKSSIKIEQKFYMKQWEKEKSTMEKEKI